MPHLNSRILSVACFKSISQTMEIRSATTLHFLVYVGSTAAGVAKRHLNAWQIPEQHLRFEVLELCDCSSVGVSKLFSALGP